MPKNSNLKVEVLCDMCKENTMSVEYYNYNNVIEKSGSYVCKSCASKKRQQTNLSRYGVEHYAQTEDFHHDMIERMQRLYGVDHYSKTLEYKEKYRNTCIDRYGVDSPNKSPKIREKITKTYYKNSSQKSSKQQRYINELYQGVLNFPIKYYNADICLPNDNLVIEYDGGGHTLRVKTGIMSQEEFCKKEVIRNVVIKREGYKQMRIISTKDLLPSDTILLQMLSQTKEYFSNYPEHSWIEYNIDTSTVRNAEQKDGVFFDYGELRKIKTSEVA